MNPIYPVFIPTKGRSASRLTAKSFDKIGVPYREVVEESDVKAYTKAGASNLLVMSNHDKGLVVTRNWIWDYAERLGTKRFWTFDDNINGLYRFNRNLKVPVTCGNVLSAIEDFVDRYVNVPIAGMQYFMFELRKRAVRDPFVLNTRVYSNMLIETSAKSLSGEKFRNEGFYNDDTDLCLRVLKDGFCTILFRAFLIMKSTTMTIAGGMTDHYQNDGRYKMAKELRDKHPDVTKITRKWGRWQHQVDYRPFARNRLIRLDDADVSSGPNEYGMVFVDKGKGKKKK